MKIYSIIALFIIFISFTACSKENASNISSNNIIWTTSDSAYHSISLYKE